MEGSLHYIVSLSVKNFPKSKVLKGGEGKGTK